VARLRSAAAARPLVALLVLGGLLRGLAAIFSQGFLASDDHHVLVGAADQLAGGLALPITYQRSILYPGAVAAIMATARAAGLQDPGVEMLLVRLAQAAYSLFAIYFVFRILERAVGRDTAVVGGMLTAAFFAMPVTAVHQLEEVVCQVPLLAAFWWWQRAEDGGHGSQPNAWALLAGVALGLALLLRLPLIGFVIPFTVLVLLRPVAPLRRIAFITGLATVIVLQGYSNVAVNHQWGYTFIQRLGPMLRPHDLALDAGGYPSSPPWHYVFTLLAAFVPPFSVLFLAAAVQGARRLPILGLATAGFFVAHSLVANKQERFLLPVVPVLLLLGAAGLPWIAGGGAWPRAYRGLWRYFWVVNGALLVVLTFSFAKKDRVAPLLYIYRRHDATGVAVAQYNQTFHVPEYYLGRPRPPLFVWQAREQAVADARVNYVVLYSDQPEPDREQLADALRSELTLLTVIPPSLADRLAHAINPRHNKARTAMIFRATPIDSSGTRTSARP
jgi:hypothetical protein